MQDQTIKLLSEFVSIQSVSTDPSRHGQILKAVDFLKKEIESLGFEMNIYQNSNYSPLIVAKSKPSFVKTSAGLENINEEMFYKGITSLEKIISQ